MLLNQKAVNRIEPLSKQSRVIEVHDAALFYMEAEMSRTARPDRDGVHRKQFDRAKKKIYATQTICGICGKPVDFDLKYPHPLSPCIDHIIPVAKGGHPSDPDNLQLAHWTCNRQKSDKLVAKALPQGMQETVSNRILPHSLDWKNFHSLVHDKDNK